MLCAGSEQNVQQQEDAGVMITVPPFCAAAIAERSKSAGAQRKRLCAQRQWPIDRVEGAVQALSPVGIGRFGAGAICLTRCPLAMGVMTASFAWRTPLCLSLLICSSILLSCRSVFPFLPSPSPTVRPPPCPAPTVYALLHLALSTVGY